MKEGSSGGASLCEGPLRGPLFNGGPGWGTWEGSFAGALEDKEKHIRVLF
jgi:hypothetical protein